MVYKRGYWETAGIEVSRDFGRPWKCWEGVVEHRPLGFCPSKGEPLLEV
jgi:hypothetical protein